MTYRDLTEDQQVETLRPVARAAAAQFGLEVAELELVAHAFNTAFAVIVADGRAIPGPVTRRSCVVLTSVW